MSKKENKNDADQLEVVGEVIENAEGFFHKYKNVLLYSLIGIAVIVGAYFGYTEFISKPRQNEANEQMFRAEQYFAVDSFSMALHGDGNSLGFLQVIENYGSTKAGNLAHFYAGVCYYRLGEYNQAIKELNSFKSDDEILAARAISVIGDSYVEMNQLDDAVKQFVKAANHNDNNYAAIYLMKAGRVCESQGKYSEALNYYNKIKTNYPKSAEAREIDKYIERAGLLAGK